jgi:hypothetical protein
MQQLYKGGNYSPKYSNSFLFPETFFLSHLLALFKIKGQVSEKGILLDTFFTSFEEPAYH